MLNIFKCICLFFSGLFCRQEMKKINVELQPLTNSTNRRPCPHPYIPCPSELTLRNIQEFPKAMSSNWSGYVSTGENVSSVSGSWVVPNIQKSKRDTYCAIWVGIDGYNSDSVEQIGTSHDYVDGKQRHYAWFEMYPREAYEIKNFPVAIGDSISASVDFVPSDSSFKMKIVNDTKKVYAEVPTKYTILKNAKRSCAEWIVEAPWMNRTLPLSNFDMVFTNSCKCTIDGLPGSIQNKNGEAEAIDMVGPNGKRKAQTSGLAGNDQNFWVKWLHE